MNVNIEKFESLVSRNDSTWHEKRLSRAQDHSWSKKATDISIRILTHLRKTNTTQSDLAEQMGVTRQYVSKIVQGKENLGLATICKIEEILGITLIEVPGISDATNCTQTQTSTRSQTRGLALKNRSKRIE